MEFSSTLAPTDCTWTLNSFISDFFDGSNTSDGQYASAVLAPAAVEQPSKEPASIQHYFSSFRDHDNEDSDSGFTDLSTPTTSSVDTFNSGYESPQTFYEMDTSTWGDNFQFIPSHSYVPGLLPEEPVNNEVSTVQSFYSEPLLSEEEPTSSLDSPMPSIDSGFESSQDCYDESRVVPASRPGPLSELNEELLRQVLMPTKSRKSTKVKPPVVPGAWFCSRCNKNFLSKKGLVQHNNSQHAGAKAHRCDACGKHFLRPEDRDRHQQRHVMSNKPHPCPHDACPKAYNSRFDLSRHIEERHGTPKHGCTLCGRRFPRKDHLMKHEESHRRETVKKFKRQRSD